MCGIVAYVGKKEACPILLKGLKRLEYRGYDSAGLAVLDGAVKVVKTVGKVDALIGKSKKEHLAGTTGIAHTRWATHGRPSDENAHPHGDCRREVAVVHNGIIENFQSLKSGLVRRGHRFTSETDTEVLAHLIEEELGKGKTLESSVRSVVKKVRGTFGLAVVATQDPGKIILARQGSPLVVGIGDGEMMAASDAAAFLAHTKKALYLDDGEMAVLTKDTADLSSFANGEKRQKKPYDIDWEPGDDSKGSHRHHMHKEIHEQPEAITNTMRGRALPKEGLAKLGGLEEVADRLRTINTLVITSCGTSYFAALVGEYLLEQYVGIPVSVELASELRYRAAPLTAQTAVLAISQSGETIDTLEAIREAKRHGALALGLVNVVGSTIARETEAGIYLHAGPEIGVASTKAFTAELTALVLLAVFLGRQRQLPPSVAKELLEELLLIPEKMRRVLAKEDEVMQLAAKYLAATNFLFLGRGYQYPIALEGALKLKEISYRHAEGYAAGEMKHGPIALIDEAFPTVALIPRASTYEKMWSNLEEIKARSGPVIAIATEGDDKIGGLADRVFFVPDTIEPLAPLLTVLPLQLFAYHMAEKLKRDIDQPRNLAKSVTVE